MFSMAIDVRAAGKLAPGYASLYFEPWTDVGGCGRFVPVFLETAFF